MVEGRSGGEDGVVLKSTTDLGGVFRCEQLPWPNIPSIETLDFVHIWRVFGLVCSFLHLALTRDRLLSAPLRKVSRGPFQSPPYLYHLPPPDTIDVVCERLKPRRDRPIAGPWWRNTTYHRNCESADELGEFDDRYACRGNSRSGTGAEPFRGRRRGWPTARRLHATASEDAAPATGRAGPCRGQCRGS